MPQALRVQEINSLLEKTLLGVVVLDTLFEYSVLFLGFVYFLYSKKNKVKQPCFSFQTESYI